MKKYRDSLDYLMNVANMMEKQQHNVLDARILFRDKTLHDLMQGHIQGIRAGDEVTTQMQSEVIRVDFKMKYVIDRTIYFNTGNAA
jgi:hypothetical protein